MWHRCRAVIVGSTDVAWSEGERADSSTRPSGPPHVVAVGARLRSRVMSDVVTYEFEGDVAVVRIDDGKANALSPDVVAALDEAVGLAETEARALMLIGRPGGSRLGSTSPMQASVESAQSLVAAGAPPGHASLRAGHPDRRRFSGHAVAMGALLLLACDTRLGAAGEFRSASTRWPSDWAYRCSASSWPETASTPAGSPRPPCRPSCTTPTGPPRSATSTVVMAGALEADARAVSSRLAELRQARTCTPRCEPARARSITCWRPWMPTSPRSAFAPVDPT